MAERGADPTLRPTARRGWTGALSRAAKSDFTQGVLSSTFAGYLRLVWRTSSFVSEPGMPQALFDAHAPFIATTWHGQAFLLPMLRPHDRPVDVLVSKADDGELIGRTLERLGCGTVRGSGAADPARMFEKGAVAAFRGLKTALDSGHSVLMTADFMRHARRQVSPGLVALARLSRRPLVPIAVASSRRWHLKSWDRTTINLPFSRIAFVYGEAIDVPPRADQAVLEAKRLELEAALNVVSDRAYALVDRRG
ncbi:lysophospholipid acyltransferase family protein [soil metagenome]